MPKLTLGNAAGTVKTVADIARLVVEPNISDVTVGSVTQERRIGNVGDTFYYHETEQWSLNALGLPNPGFTQYVAWLPEMLELCSSHGKKLRMSVAGFSPQEYAMMTCNFLDAGVEEVELNLSCPNVAGKPVASENPQLTDDILKAVRGALPNGGKVAVKIGPCIDEGVFLEIVDILRNREFISCVVATNTIPREQDVREEDGRLALWWCEQGSTYHKPMGGRGGAPLLERNIRTVKYLRQQLRPDQRIIGLGGIFTGADMLAYFEAGASGVQSATAHLKYGNALYSRLLQEFVALPQAGRFIENMSAAAAA